MKKDDRHDWVIDWVSSGDEYLPVLYSGDKVSLDLNNQLLLSSSSQWHRSTRMRVSPGFVMQNNHLMAVPSKSFAASSAFNSCITVFSQTPNQQLVYTDYQCYYSSLCPTLPVLTTTVLNK
ncbi:unnamed protein product, partial [Oppiella nova]